MSEGWLDKIAEGGLPQLILGKHGSEAIGQLVGGVTGIPVEWLNQQRQKIADRSAARSKITAAEADLAVEALKGDDALRARAIDRWLGVQERAQVNREKVAKAAVEDLKANPSTAEDPVDPDFMAQFEAYAERATSDEMQALFGRVLAGEIRKPGAFSLAALHRLSLLDKVTAQALEKVAAWTVSEAFVLRSPTFLSGPRFGPLQTLFEAGIVSSAEAMVQVSRREGRIWLPWPDYVFELSDCGPVVGISGFRFTKAGAQILSLASPKPSTESDRREFAIGIGEASRDVYRVLGSRRQPSTTPGVAFSVELPQKVWVGY